MSGRVLVRCCVLAGVWALAAAGAEPAVAFTPGGVEVTGLGPGGAVAVVGAVWDRDPYGWVLAPFRGVASADGAGRAVVSLPRSSWRGAGAVTVDLATGEAVVAAEGAGAPRFPVPELAWRRRDGVAVLEVAARDVVAVWWSGGRVWFAEAHDGGPGDADGVVDGVVRLGPAAFAAGDDGPGPAPALWRSGDGVGVVELEHLAGAVTRVPAEEGGR